MLQPDDSYEEEMRALAEDTAAGITTRNTLSEVETRARAEQAAFAEMTAEHVCTGECCLDIHMHTMYVCVHLYVSMCRRQAARIQIDMYCITDAGEKRRAPPPSFGQAASECSAASDRRHSLVTSQPGQAYGEGAGGGR